MSRRSWRGSDHSASTDLRWTLPTTGFYHRPADSTSPQVATASALCRAGSHTVHRAAFAHSCGEPEHDNRHRSGHSRPRPARSRRPVPLDGGTARRPFCEVNCRLYSGVGGINTCGPYRLSCDAYLVHGWATYPGTVARL